MPAVVLTITDADCLFALGATEPPDWTTGGEDFRCQVTKAQLVAAPELADVPATFCQAATQVPGVTGYTLELSGLQDWTEADGLSMFLFTNDAAEGWVKVTLPTKASGAKTASVIAHVRFVAGAFGGEAGTPLTFDATFPVQGKPDVTQATNTVAAAVTGEEELATLEEVPA